jgi:hypothetical protein
MPSSAFKFENCAAGGAGWIFHGLELECFARQALEKREARRGQMSALPAIFAPCGLDQANALFSS